MTFYAQDHKSFIRFIAQSVNILVRENSNNDEAVGGEKCVC